MKFEDAIKEAKKLHPKATVEQIPEAYAKRIQCSDNFILGGTYFPKRKAIGVLGIVPGRPRYGQKQVWIATVKLTRTENGVDYFEG